MFLRSAKDLVDSSASLVAAQRDDQAFNLPPVAEARNIAVVPAALSARGGFDGGIIAMLFDQRRRIRERHAAMDEKGVHVGRNNAGPLPDRR